MFNIKKGDKYKELDKHGNELTIPFHIRGTIDKNWVVYKFWYKEKQEWIYMVEKKSYFERLWRQGRQKKL